MVFFVSPYSCSILSYYVTYKNMEYILAFNYSNGLTSYKTNTRIECAVNCNMNYRCTSFLFNFTTQSGSKNCYLYLGTIDNEVPNTIPSLNSDIFEKSCK